MTDFYRTGTIYTLGVAIQTESNVYKAPGNGTGVFIPYAKSTPQHGIEDAPITGHTAHRGNEIKYIRKSVDPKFELDSPCWLEAGAEQLIFGALGSKAAPAQQGGTAAYKHAITEHGTSLPELSLTMFNSGSEVEAYKNAMVDVLKIDYKEGEIDMTANFYNAPIDLSQSVPTKVYPNNNPFVFKNFTCKLGGYGTFTFTDSDITVGTDVIAKDDHRLNTGDAVTVSNSGGALPTGLVAATTYYAIWVTDNTFKLASSLANAKAGTAVDITVAGGGGTHTLDKSVPLQNSTVTSANLEINNHIIATAVANNSYDKLKIPGKLSVEGRVEFPMQNMDELRNYIGGDAQATTTSEDIRERSLILQLTGGIIASTYRWDLTFNIPRVALTPCEIKHEDEAMVGYGFDFKAMRDSNDVMITADIISRLTAIT